MGAHIAGLLQRCMPFIVGNWIEHSAFGTGLITAEDAPYFVIRFVSGGEKRLKKDFITTAGSPPSPDFRFPAASGAKSVGQAPGSRSKKIAHSFEHFVERFLTLYPSGFEDAAFERDEREYKFAAVKRFSENLDSSALDALISSKDYAEVCRRARYVVSATNLIFPHELMAMNDAFKESARQELFASSLRDMLYGEAEKQRRFEDYVATLGKIGCAKWTIATYFQFLESKGQDMFMKPKVSQAMAHAIGLSLLYRPEPNWETYARLQDIALGVQSRLERVGLHPRDRIDLQSFMYVSWHHSK